MSARSTIGTAGGKHSDVRATRVQGPSRNTAARLRARSASSVEGTTVNGWQAEVAPPELFTGGIYESYGRGWLVQPDEVTVSD